MKIYKYHFHKGNTTINAKVDLRPKTLLLTGLIALIAIGAVRWLITK
ncbi:MULTISPECIES: hypothetical protein [unclassified Lactobacillus]|nr:MULTISPECIES: hypothetical protein [unclassified Lactobacillus]